MKMLAWLSALFICGSGQIINRYYAKGLVLLFAFAGFLALGFSGLLSDSLLALLGGLGSFACAICTWVYSLIDFYEHSTPCKKKSQIDDKMDPEYLNGLAYYMMGEYDNALKQFSSMLLKNKKDTDLYYQMAVTYYKKGDFKKVREFGTLYLSFDDNKWEKEILKLLEFCK